MKVIDLIEKLNFLIDNGYIEKDDEIIVIGTGEKQSGTIGLGLCMPKVLLDPNLDKMRSSYGLGIAMKQLDPEISECVNKNIWELLGDGNCNNEIHS